MTICGEWIEDDWTELDSACEYEFVDDGEIVEDDNSEEELYLETGCGG